MLPMYDVLFLPGYSAGGCFQQLVEANWIGLSRLPTGPCCDQDHLGPNFGLQMI